MDGTCWVCFCCQHSPVWDMNVRIFGVSGMEYMCAQTRPRFILSSKQVWEGMESEPMKLQGKNPLCGENSPQRRIEPMTLQQTAQGAQHNTNELFGPPLLSVSELFGPPLLSVSELFGPPLLSVSELFGPPLLSVSVSLFLWPVWRLENKNLGSSPCSFVIDGNRFIYLTDLLKGTQKPCSYFLLGIWLSFLFVTWWDWFYFDCLFHHWTWCILIVYFIS